MKYIKKANQMSSEFKSELEKIFPEMTDKQRQKLNLSFIKFTDKLFDLIFEELKLQLKRDIHKNQAKTYKVNISKSE